MDMTYDKLPIGTKVKIVGDLLDGDHDGGFSYIGLEGTVSGVGGVYTAEYTLDLDVDEKWSDYFFYREELEVIND